MTKPWVLIIFNYLVNQITNSLFNLLACKLIVDIDFYKFWKSNLAPSDVIMLFPKFNSVKGGGNSINKIKPFSIASSVSLFSLTSIFCNYLNPNILSQAIMNCSSFNEQFLSDSILRCFDMQIKVASLAIDFYFN